MKAIEPDVELQDFETTHDLSTLRGDIDMEIRTTVKNLRSRCDCLREVEKGIAAESRNRRKGLSSTATRSLHDVVGTMTDWLTGTTWFEAEKEARLREAQERVRASTKALFRLAHIRQSQGSTRTAS